MENYQNPLWVQPMMNYGFAPLEQYQQMQSDAAQRIITGLHTYYASTGACIDSLPKGAQITATLAAIGGGTINSGGNGIVGGIQALMQYAFALGASRGYCQGYQQAQNGLYIW